MQQGVRLPSLSKQKEILAMLTKCSLRRGAAVNMETLAIYVQDLSSYELGDIAAVLEDIGKESPQDFKQLWPAVGVFLEALRARIRANRPSVDEEAAERWKSYLEAVKAEGTQEPDAEIEKRIAALNARMGL